MKIIRSSMDGGTSYGLHKNLLSMCEAALRERGDFVYRILEEKTYFLPRSLRSPVQRRESRTSRQKGDSLVAAFVDGIVKVLTSSWRSAPIMR
jgi:hypothetical protein